MSKKLWSVVLAGALVASVFSALPARAASGIPEVVQVDDPVGDANFINDQDNAYGTPAAGQGDHVGPADVGSATDLMKVWFSNTADEVALSFQTEGNPNRLAYDTYFRFSSNAGEGPVAKDTTRGCLQWIASINGAAGAYQGETEGTLVDKCNVGGAAVVGPLETWEVGDGTFATTITFSRDASPLLADGGTITAPFGVSRIVYVGPSPTTAAVVTVDTTKRGVDYAITTGGGAPTEPPVMEEPPAQAEGPKAKDCSKIKNKKKRKKCIKQQKAETPADEGCAAYVPGEMGAELETETAVVTDEATEETPLEFDIPIGPALGATNTRQYYNVQVDSKAAEAGLFVKLESPVWDDPDLYVYWPNGKRAAVAGGFNQALVAGPLPAAVNDRINLNGTGSGGHSGFGYEQIDGLRTPDCAGWTLDLVNWLGQGGTYKLKLWLGEITNDPMPAE